MVYWGSTRSIGGVLWENTKEAPGTPGDVGPPSVILYRASFSTGTG